MGHDEGVSSGDFAQSLNFVDILTGWDESAACINKLYKYLGHYTNFFQPVVKLVFKTRKGSSVPIQQKIYPLLI